MLLQAINNYHALMEFFTQQFTLLRACLNVSCLSYLAHLQPTVFCNICYDGINWHFYSEVGTIIPFAHISLILSSG